jgi:hypothetical protein
MKKAIAALLVAAALATPAAAYDLNTVTEKTAEQLAVYMHPETRHLAEEVVRICAEQEVSAEFIAAVMRWERRPDLCNWFGWSEGDKLLVFYNDLHCLETVIPKIKANYLTPGGIYYNGATVEGVSVYYNNTDFWRETIKAEVEAML